MALLNVNNVSKNFGGLRAISYCSMEIPKGSITGLIGPNGAGKTTLFNVIAGFLSATEGEVRFRDEVISGLPAHVIARKGLVRTFQTPHGFTELTVMENLLAAPLNQEGENVWKALTMPPSVRRQEKEYREKVLYMLEKVKMVDRRNEKVGNLSSGEARMVELVRQLMLDPELLLLDEPAAGINPAVQDQLVEMLRDLQKGGLTLLIIDHNLGFITSLSHRIYVMSAGEIILEGDPESVMRNDQVKKIYLGERE